MTSKWRNQKEIPTPKTSGKICYETIKFKTGKVKVRNEKRSSLDEI